jgi:hypothetical protein
MPSSRPLRISKEVANTIAGDTSATFPGEITESKLLHLSRCCDRRIGPDLRQNRYRVVTIYFPQRIAV